MAFITKAAPKKPTKALNTSLDSTTKDKLEAYVEFIGRPTGEVVNDILVAVFEQDKEFAEWKSHRPTRRRGERKTNKQGKVETMPEAQWA
jgi:hypothetical protein